MRNGAAGIVAENVAELNLTTTNNAAGDPLFVDVDGVDNVLGNADDDLRLDIGSSAIDLGNTNAIPADVNDADNDNDTAESVPFDLGGAPRVTGPSVDAGAYERQ